MANTLSAISLVCFGAAALSLLTAAVLYFGFNTKAAYQELKGQTYMSWIEKGKGRKKHERKIRKVPAGREDAQDEMVTEFQTRILERTEKECDTLRIITDLDIGDDINGRGEGCRQFDNRKNKWDCG